jgi:hypothetical protein
VKILNHDEQRNGSPDLISTLNRPNSGHFLIDAPAFAWRDHLPVHPAADLFPLMSEAELKELAEDLLAHGQRMLIMLCKSPDGTRLNVLDGRNRLDAMALTGRLRADDDGELYFGDEMVGLIGVKSDPYETVVSFNLHRRHLTSEQKRDLIAKLLKAQPEKSDRQIAGMAKADHKTVATVRSGEEGRGEIPHVEVRTDSKGRAQPARRSGGPRHKCWQCGARALVGEVNQHKYAAYEEADVWLHDSCVAAFEAEIERDRKECIALYQKACAAERELAQWRADHPVETDGAEASADEELEESKEAIRFSGILNLMCATILRTMTAAVAAEMQTTPGQINLLREATNFLLDVMVELDEPTPPDTPTDPGPTPDGETRSKDTEEPAQTVTVSVEEPTAPIDRSLDIPDPLIQAARQRHPVASAPQDTSVPLTPLAPSPAPAPSPSPSPSPKLKVAPHYLPAHKDPWPANWRSLGAAELEEVIHATREFGVNHRLEDRHHRQLARMRERLDVLRKSDRAELPTSAEARP